MTILKTDQTNKANQFKQAADSWDLERLYADLATVKGEELTETEQLHLRGLLCGYNSSTLAEKLYKSPGGLRSDISKYVNYYVKELVHQKQRKLVKRLKSGEVLKWLEDLGYKKSVAVSSNGLTIQIENGLTIQIDAAAGSVVKISKSLVGTTNNSRVLFSLPAEEFPKLLGQLEKNERGKKMNK